MHFLIDADSLIYKAGCSNERHMYVVLDGVNVVADFKYKKDAVDFKDDDELLSIEYYKEALPIKGAYSNIFRLMSTIVSHPRCKTFDVFISGDTNFRYGIDPSYKSNRSVAGRPLQEKEIREYLIKHWGAIVVDNIEVDDEVSIRCVEDPLNSVIVTIDKDLDNTAGWHYNYDKELTYYVDEETANLNFYRQLLSGDPTDSIKGCPRIGKVRAAELLPLAMRPDLLLRKVYKVYSDAGLSYEYLVQQGQLLWMLRERGVMWQPPLTEEELLAFQTNKEND